jgi:hypothetical protein
MANEEKITFPSIPAKQWWALRSKFRQSMPPSVTPGYLAAALGMNEASAKANVLPALVAFRIVDQDGKPTERAKQWRDDEQYAGICEQIRQEVYPPELVHALPPPSPHRESVERWIANKTGVGQKAAEKLALTYLMLCDANPQSKPDTSAATPVRTPTRTAKPRSAPPGPAVAAKPAVSVDEMMPMAAAGSKTAAQPAIAASSSGPTLHIDIQIHISPDAPSDQIDQIFASMAKHLYRRGE